MIGTALFSSSECILTVLEEVLQEKGWDHMMYEEMMGRLHLLNCEKMKGSCLQLPDWRMQTRCNKTKWSEWSCTAAGEKMANTIWNMRIKCKEKKNTMRMVK